MICVPGLEPAGRGSCIPRRDRYDCWQRLKVAEDVMADGGEMLLTVFLKHRQSMNLAEINQKLEQTGFWRKFPPPGVEVVSWYVMMGIGQVVTLRLAADQLRAVNLAIEQNAWGAFETEFYPTYDFRPVWDGIKSRAEAPPAVTR
jgi:uncharacterized protein with GYD domain